MKKILVLVPGYLPGFKSGGPVRTIQNMIDCLSGEILFSVVCRDRDLGDKNPYQSIRNNEWNRVGGADVFYISPGFLGILRLWGLLRGGGWDFIYLNSYFSFVFSILPVLLRRIFRLRVSFIVAPRGEFSEGALALKSIKKKIFIFFSKTLGLYRGVVWHASTIYEAADIRRVMGDAVSVRIAVDLARKDGELPLTPRSIADPLRVVFISRISEKKNLSYAFRVLSRVNIPVVFDVYGPVEDEKYWKHCLKFAAELPDNVKFNYRGALAPNEVVAKLTGYDLFLLPTLGENFGHVIAEAFFSGLPVLISDATPWRDLEAKGVGWDIPLSDMDRFVEGVEFCYKYPLNEFVGWRLRIRAWAAQNIGNDEAIQENMRLFEV